MASNNPYIQQISHPIDSSISSNPKFFSETLFTTEVSHKRKRLPQRKEDELLAFGYEARLFLDDGVAQRNDFLIPWKDSIGDEQVLIDSNITFWYWWDERLHYEGKLKCSVYVDIGVEMECRVLKGSGVRYDVRHYLDELPDSQASCFCKDREALESALDEERFRDLDSDEERLFEMSDEEEREEYVEEKRKRRKMEAENKLFEHSYEEGATSHLTEDSATQLAAPEEDIEPALKPKLMSIPNGIKTPKTLNHYEIIHRTAKFISIASNPSQIEITIQAKQAGNPSFSFLNRDDTLHPFYKHLRWILGSGIGGYGSDEEEEEEEQGQEEKGKNMNESSDISKAAPVEMPEFPPVVLQRWNEELATVVPPPDLKQIIDKTAHFVAKSGRALELRIIEKNAGDDRFAFLSAKNEFNAYYRKTVRELGGEIEIQVAGPQIIVSDEQRERLERARNAMAKTNVKNKLGA